MKHIIIVCLALTSLGKVVDVAAQEDWWHLGGQNGIAWDSVVDFSLLIDNTSTPGALQPWELKPDENVLTKLEFWQRWRFPTDPHFRAGHPRFWTDINHSSIYEATDVFDFVDGDPTTFVSRKERKGIFYTMDMGAQLPLERFVFYPPEGINLESDEPFRPNYILKSYSLTGSPEETGILEEELKRGFKWRGVGPCCALETPLGQEERNRDAITEITFPLQKLQFLRLIAIPDGFTTYGSPIVTRSAFAEMEAYGRGFVPRAVWESQVIDLGREVNFGRILIGISTLRREGDQLISDETAGARSKVSLRTGRDDSPIAYFGFNDLGKHVEVSKKAWDRLTPLEARGATVAVGARGPIAEDRENWSFWSLPLEQSGQRSRVPWGRFLQLRVLLETESFWNYARLDSLSIEISPLLADRVLGEVVSAHEFHPQGGRVKVKAGEQTEFIYAIKAEFANASRTGFDALQVLAPAAGSFQWLEMGNPLQRVEPDSVISTTNGFTLFLPQRISPQGHQHLRIGLESALYGEAGEFGGEAFERDKKNILQQVEGGNVSDDLGSDQLLIVASIISAEGVLGQVLANPRIFTPQGDGINDQVQINYTLFRVQEPVPVRIAMYNLNGQRIRQLEPQLLRLGSHSITWDGRDATGQLVEPGIYLAQIGIEIDQGNVEKLLPIAVAY